MPRMKAVVAYDGTRFSGSQIQPQLRTVQGEIETVLKKMHKGQFVRIFPSGRTDTGVHALGQTIHFDTALHIDESRWLRAFHALLPEDIYVSKVEMVDANFHARFHAQRKEYRYRLLTTRKRDVFRRQYTHHVPEQLDVRAMEVALAEVIGTHDFTSFCSAQTTVPNKVRTLYEASLFETDDELVMRFVGNGFLHHMVRILVGTVLEVGKRERNPEDVQAILRARSRAQAGMTAPAHGLVLWSVHYDNEGK